MGLRQTADPKRDYYPLQEAARIVRTLQNSELRVAKAEQWLYLLDPKPGNPNLAAVKVIDEKNEFVGYWYR